MDPAAAADEEVYNAGGLKLIIYLASSSTSSSLGSLESANAFQEYPAHIPLK